MSRFEHIKIYDNQGNKLSCDTQGNLFWNENIHFPVVSQGLFETTSLFIFEETLEGLNTPKSSYTNSKWRLRFDKEIKPNEEENFFFYEIDWNDEFPEISKKRELIISLQDGSSTAVDTLTNKLFLGKNNIPIQINIGFTSKIENTFIDYLILEEIIDDDDIIKHNEENSDIFYKKDNSWVELIGIFKLYGETEGEDERFSHLLENLGLELKQENWYLFKEAPIEDDSIDWTIINSKRKELLLEHSNIWPYIGSYKGLRNVLNWLGWNDLSIKEFWKNIHNNNRNSQEIWENNSYLKSLKTSDVWKKTGELQFTYKFNLPSNELDDFGLPIVSENENFTIDEILFKLWGLKKFLQDSFLPLGTKIIDITGEGFYFEKYNLSTWTNKLKIWNISTPQILYADWNTPEIISDWSWKINNWGYDSSGNIIDNLSNSIITLNDIAADTLGNYYSHNLFEYLAINLPFYPLDNSNPLIGTPIKLSNKSFQLSWDTWNTTWDTLTNVTWDDLQWGKFLEMEWILSKKEPNAISISSGKKLITSIHEWETFLPYCGNWNLTLKMWDDTNTISERTWVDFIDVKNKNIELSLISKYYSSYNTWDSLNDTTWNNLSTSWNTLGNTLENNNHNLPSDITMGKFLNENYNLLETNTYDLNYVNNHLGNKITWDRLDDITWDDLSNITWDDYDIHGDVRCGFNILSWSTGGTIIMKGISTFTFIGSTITNLVDELNSSTLNGFKNFIYSIIKPTSTPSTWFIQAVAKTHSYRNFFLLEFTGGFTGENSSVKFNTYPHLNWSTWPGTEFWYNSTWRGWKEHLSSLEGHNNTNWNNILTNYGSEEYVNKTQLDISRFITDWVNSDTSWLQSNTYNFNIGNPILMTHIGSKIPKLKIDSWEVIINNDRKILCESDFMWWLPLEKNDIQINIKGRDGNNNLIENSYNLKHV